MTLDRLRRVFLRWEGLHEDGVDPKEVVLDAYDKRMPVTIYYKDGNGRRTSRMIEPLEIKTNPYTGMERVKSYCHLRRAERTFILDRIVNAIPADTELSIISKDEL